MALGGNRVRTALDELQRELGDCERCSLASGRGRVVFGVGPEDARVMLVGEAPGRAEDLGGKPFMGAAGRLLDELLEGIGLRRDDVYIANVLKCRPPLNRDPLAQEVAACEPVLRRQIELIDPDVVVTLGRFATRSVSGHISPITELHGKPLQVEGRTVLPVFHPAAALYDPSKRDLLRHDFETLAGILGLTPGACGTGPTRGVITAATEADTRRAGVLLGRVSRADEVIALSGGLGAGKTALVQGVAEGLGFAGNVPSPTFNLMLVHPGDMTLFHFDLYRLENADQLEDIGFYETLESGGVSAVEWADKFPGELPDDRLDVRIEVLDEGGRSLCAEAKGPRSQVLLSRWMADWSADLESGMR